MRHAMSKANGVALCIALAWALAGGIAAAGTIHYVDAGVSGGADNGDDWANAYTNLQDALSEAVGADEIWVAQGTYYPAAAGSPGVSFNLVAGTGLYGGFTNGMASAADRDPDAYPTVLSGDIDRDGVSDANNTARILVAAADATIDGFIVTCAYHGTSSGAGMYASGKANVTVRSCLFSNNYANSGAAGIYVNTSSMTVENCRFVANRALSGGGTGMYVYKSTVTVSGCRFYGNRNAGGNTMTGGAIRLELESATTWEDCIFANNRSTWTGGCVYMGDTITSARFNRCLFTDNQAISIYGGAIVGPNVFGLATIENSVICGNRSADSNSRRRGGAFYQYSGTLRNCVISGNGTPPGYQSWGGAFDWANGGRVAIESCTIADNWAENNGGALHCLGVLASITNTILWGNSDSSGEEIYNYNYSTQTMSYVNLEGGWDGPLVYNGTGSDVVDAGGNTNANPLFAGGTSGSWTADAAYDAVLGQSTLTDNTAAWTPNEWAETFLNPNGAQFLHYYVISNSATTVHVWGDATVVATNGAAYQGYDYHLKSQYGRWTALGWVTDSTNSPLINAGHPDFDASFEPPAREVRINIGAYGNTAQASRSQPPPSGTLVMVL